MTQRTMTGPVDEGERVRPHDHLVGFYETDAFLVDSVVDFLRPAWCRGESVLVIATPEHRAAFDAALEGCGIDVAAARSDGRYVALDAARTLATFVSNGSIDYDHFRASVIDVVDRMTARGRGVRIFGEMVALLWELGDVDGALTLEAMWNGLGRSREFSLFCAYGLSTFDAEETSTRFHQVCEQHSAVTSESYAQLGGDRGGTGVVVLDRDAPGGRQQRRG